MARKPDPAKRAQLLRAIVEYLEEHGVADLSLAPLAEAAGTTKRMLLYYFQDRSTLMEEALAASRPDVAGMFDGVHDRDSLREAVRALWTAITEGEQRRSIRMLLQVLSLATTQPDVYGSFASTAVEVMLDPIAAGFRRAGHTPERARVGATLVVSGLRGLCQDLLVTGDSGRVHGAAEALIEAATA
ncbi:TetR/AcrR family transcriptional regulator [Actinopolyspora saharensis]|uniref:DNA-binding transcriptional regulator, AcrR family n=1 Tax=Actinopolyspora saharensis TaxID=995062 RepID=A0A1H0YMX9_9ACTN|nr:TetR/AcrR family transcriptional regulator [Actinopolyspora saharensis]SDQ16470.1 DNA-binding transcriptional regulator, AcrR family [Actinopolyspora saharensis]